MLILACATVWPSRMQVAHRVWSWISCTIKPIPTIPELLQDFLLPLLRTFLRLRSKRFWTLKNDPHIFICMIAKVICTWGITYLNTMLTKVNISISRNGAIVWFYGQKFYSMLVHKKYVLPGIAHASQTVTKRVFDGHRYRCDTFIGSVCRCSQ